LELRVEKKIAVPSKRMSSARRAYDLIRGYVNHGWDHLSETEEGAAQGELKEAMESLAPRSDPVTAAAPKGAAPVVEPEPITLEQARKLFDVSPNATSRQIVEVYDMLRETIDLGKFPEGSESWQRARMVGRRLDGARNILIQNIDPTVRRFERLEIE
jgi:hypothetical protein